MTTLVKLQMVKPLETAYYRAGTSHYQKRCKIAVITRKGTFTPQALL